MFKFPCAVTYLIYMIEDSTVPCSTPWYNNVRCNLIFNLLNYCQLYKYTYDLSIHINSKFNLNSQIHNTVKVS